MKLGLWLTDKNGTGCLKSSSLILFAYEAFHIERILGTKF
jgi:hypothetical protein